MPRFCARGDAGVPKWPQSIFLQKLTCMLPTGKGTRGWLLETFPDKEKSSTEGTVEDYGRQLATFNTFK